MNEDEMLSDLAAADAAGDSALAQHIAGQIKAQRTPPDTHGLPAKIAHYGAMALPALGGVGGALLSGTAGIPTGPGALLTGAAGVGLGAASGRALQKSIDMSLGYDRRDEPLTHALADVGTTGLRDATYATGGGVAMAGMAKAAPAVAGALEGGALATGRRILRNVGGSLSKAKALPDEAVREAFNQGAFKFGGTSGGAAQRLEAAREAVGQRYAQILGDLEKQGITGPDAQRLAMQYAQRAQTINAGTMNPAVPKIYESAAERLNDMVKPPQLVRVPGQSPPTPGAVQLPPVTAAPPQTATISDFEKLAAMEGAPVLPLARSAEANARAVGGGVDAQRMQRILAGRSAGSGGTANAREARDAADALYTAERMGAAEGLPAMSLPGEAERLAVAAGEKQAPQQMERFALPPPAPRSAPAYELRPADNRLSLTRTEELKRSLQGMAKSAYAQRQPNEVGQAHEATASMMRQAVEDEIAKQTTNASPAVQDVAAQFVPVKQQAGRLIQASNVAREGMDRAKNRAAISLPDWLAVTAELTRSHSPLQAAASGLATHLARTRGPSSAAVLLKGASELAGAFPSIAPQAERAAMSLSPAAAERSQIEAMIQALLKRSTPAAAPQLADASQQ